MHKAHGQGIVWGDLYLEETPPVIRRTAPWLLVVAAVGVNQVGIWSSNFDLSQWGQMFIVPSVVLATIRRLRLWTFAMLSAFIAYWAGDVVPRFVQRDWHDLVMLALFLLGHICLIMATRYRQELDHARPRLALVISTVAGVVTLGISLFKAPWLAIWVALYSATLAGLTYRLAGWSKLAFVGGMLFILSNSMLAVRIMLDISSQFMSSTTMLAYAAALCLMAVTLVRPGPGQATQPRSGSATP